MKKENTKEVKTSHLDRKPNLETESLRIWKLTKDEEKNDEIMNYKSQLKVDIETGKITNKKDALIFVDFRIIKEKSKIVTAFKIKRSENHLVYYINPMLSESKYKKIESSYDIFRQMGFQVTDMVKDILPSIRAEMKIMTKDKKEKVILE